MASTLLNSPMAHHNSPTELPPLSKATLSRAEQATAVTTKRLLPKLNTEGRAVINSSRDMEVSKATHRQVVKEATAPLLSSREDRLTFSNSSSGEPSGVVQATTLELTFLLANYRFNSVDLDRSGQITQIELKQGERAIRLMWGPEGTDAALAQLSSTEIGLPFQMVSIVGLALPANSLTSSAIPQTP